MTEEIRLDAVILRGSDMHRIEKRGDFAVVRVGEEFPEYHLDRAAIEKAAFALGLKVLEPRGRGIEALIPTPNTLEAILRTNGKDEPVRTNAIAGDGPARGLR